MKILRIRLENLNSLKGAHEIDLTAEPLAGAGLFAITGPTGAGKTTLLDAVTLALYGRAARYGNDPNPENMMSRHCGECSAEVAFEVPDGKRAGVYRAVWERHRARKKPDGALQQPRRYVYDEAGTPLAQKIQEAERLIEELIGLDYGRFLRSALLAQGEFARFLKADADERAGLLESLTGTEIYSTLSKLAHTEASRFENMLAEKEAAIEQIEILDGETRKELEAFVKRGAGQMKTLDREIKAGGEMLKNIERLEERRRNAKRAEKELERIKEDRAAVAEDLKRLRAHRATEPFADDLVRLDTAESAWKSARKKRESAESEHRRAKAALVRAHAVLRASVGAALVAGNRESRTAAGAVEREARAAESAAAWLAAHQSDEVLAGQLGDLVAAVGDVKSARVSLGKSWVAWKSSADEILPESAAALPESAESLAESELEFCLGDFLAAAEKERAALKTAGEEARRQFDLRRDHLEKAKLVASLESHRHRLEDGDPCPLCGALEHPYAEGAAPAPEIEGLEAEAGKAEGVLKDARDRYRDFTGELKRLADGRAPIVETRRGLEAHVSRLGPLLASVGVPVPVAGEEAKLSRSIQQREKQYRDHLGQRDKAEKRKAEARRRADEAARTVRTLEEKLAALGEASAEEAGGDVPDVEDLPSVPDAESARDESASRETASTARHSERRDAETQAESKFSNAKGALESRLSVTGIGTTAALRKARLPGGEAEKIEKDAESLKIRHAKAEMLAKTAGEEIEKLLGKKIPEGEEAANFKRRHGGVQQKRDELLREQTRRATRIETDDENRKLRRAKEKEMKKERDELTVWRRLRELVGSHDGKKFRRYAQTISLDILARFANRHLVRLSDRYVICRDEAETLNLQIEDIDQAGARRPMASLSGGESFLVSLALALGLSDLAGRTVRIDSLFIDEGFGSLDSETLETAISALESLRQSRKTVGVISHVSLLKERIATRIVVEKLPGGCSTVVVEGG